ncbi:MAG: radical SAM protein [Acidobacteria bacterium]|jgi:radical SAM protein with 4Fe4S-binding SPASM domain|nr:radical SAM protein [Acidobacteriota bacterium]
MGRTLFQFSKKDKLVIGDAKNYLSYKYDWLPQVQFLKINDSYLIVNPLNGAWVVLDMAEYEKIKEKSYPLIGRKGEFFYQLGFCSRDNQVNVSDCHSEFMDQLYFFEFAVTRGCNLACKYCFAEAGTRHLNEKATPGIAEIFIDRIAERRVQSRAMVPYIVEFTGGEPLLNFEIIRHTVNYTKMTYGDLLDVSFVIQSNMTLFNDEMLDFIKEHNICVGTSCDGFKLIHDKQRPLANLNGSFDLVEANIHKIREKCPGILRSVIGVITEESVDKMAEIFLFLHLLGYGEINLRPMATLGRGFKEYRKKPFAKHYVEGLFKILTDVISPIYNETRQLVQENFLARTFQNLFKSYRAFMCERTPCGGAKNICIVMPNGDVYPCNQSTDDTQLLLGNIKTNSFNELLNSKPAQKLGQRILDNIEECNNCVFRSWCGSPCPHEAFTTHGSLMAKSAECDIFKERYETALTGLINGTFDLEVIGKLAGFDMPLEWYEII